MCGIAGKVYLNSQKVSQFELEAMSQKIAHRGPDDEGFYVSLDKKIGLVGRRLAIIDLSSAGHQPMCYQNRYWITFNGEIYNFQQLRKDLEKDDYEFKSHSDTEIILALYSKYKEKCLDYLRGMFAFAIYDTQKNTLFLARDRMGKKPLKYYFRNGVFIFASELKAILTQKEVSAEEDANAIDYYFTYGYCPAPLTGFKNIFKLEPGHFMILNLATKVLQKVQYWQPDFSHKLNLSEHEWQERIMDALSEAVKLRMIADVPLGALLSGGVDSSAVVALMAKHSRKPIKTFSVGFKDSDYDESIYAQRIVDEFHTEHTKLFVEPQSLELLPQLAYQHEEPFADSSTTIVYLVCKLARQAVTVVLNGDGGDENFAGYSRHVRLSRDLGIYKNKPLVQLLTKFKGWPKTIVEKIVNYNSFFPATPKTLELFVNKFAQARSSDVRDQALFADLTSYLTDDLLAKMDIASMSVSLETRSPLLDRKLIELTSQIPYDLKLKGGVTKYIFKKTLETIIPKENLYRPKMGFSIPLSKWFKGDLKKFMLQKLQNSPKAQHLFTLESSDETILRLWNLLSLQLWRESYF